MLLLLLLLSLPVAAAAVVKLFDMNGHLGAAAQCKCNFILLSLHHDQWLLKQGGDQVLSSSI